jgi:diketogulonate reductase-like aldo/keto reductase
MLTRRDSAFAAGDDFFPYDKNGVLRLEDTPATETWKGMEKVFRNGKAKAIGVSNFNIRRLEELLEVAEVVPAVNQIEAHPYIQQKELKEFCESKGILIQAYSPLGNNETNSPRTIDDPKVQELSKELGMDAGQVLIAWAIQRGTVVLPKSVTEHRIISNFQVKELPKEAFDRLNAMEKHHRYNDPSGKWGYDIFDEFGADEAAQRSAKDKGPEKLKELQK